MTYQTRYTQKSFGTLKQVEVKKIPNSVCWADRDENIYHDQDLFADPDELAEIMRRKLAAKKVQKTNEINELFAEIDDINKSFENIDNFLSEIEHQADSEICRQNE